MASQITKKTAKSEITTVTNERELEAFKQSNEYQHNKAACEKTLLYYQQSPHTFMEHAKNKEKSDAWFNQAQKAEKP